MASVEPPLYKNLDDATPTLNTSKQTLMMLSGPLKYYAVVLQTNFCLLSVARKWMKEEWSVGESSNYRYLWAVSIPPLLRLQVVILIHSESRGSLHLELVCIKYRLPFIWASPSCLYFKALFWNTEVFVLSLYLFQLFQLCIWIKWKNYITTFCYRWWIVSRLWRHHSGGSIRWNNLDSYRRVLCGTDISI